MHFFRTCHIEDVYYRYSASLQMLDDLLAISDSWLIDCSMAVRVHDLTDQCCMRFAIIKPELVDV